jgi:Tfp pilus assembly protein PilF
LQPSQASYLRDLAQLYVELGRLDAAEDTFAEAVAVDPRDSLSYNDWGLFLYDQERFDEAIAQFQEARRLAPDNPTYLTNIGDAYWKQERHAEAAQWYEQALAIAPNDDYALASLGLVLWLQGQPEQAIEQLIAAIAINSQVLWYHTTLAYAQIEAGDLAGAQETVGQAILLAPNDPDVQDLQAILAEQNPQD